MLIRVTVNAQGNARYQCESCGAERPPYEGVEDWLVNHLLERHTASVPVEHR